VTTHHTERAGRLRVAPRLVRHEGERHATWLELFFDLVVVIAVAQLAHVLHDDLSVAGFAAFAGLFVPVWLSWMNYAYYADQFDTDDVVFRLVLLVAMAGVGVLSVSVGPAAHGDGALFAGTVAVLRLVVAGLYAATSRQVLEAATFCRRYALTFATGGVLWLASLAVDGPARYALWALASTIELVGMFLGYYLTRPAPVHTSHMPERFGLLTIIVLGETILVVALAVEELAWTTEATAAAALAFVIASCLWWGYFDHIDMTSITRGTEAHTLRELLPSYVHGYGSLPIYVGLTAFGVGAEAAILHAGDGHLGTGERAALGLGLALFLAVAAAQQATSAMPVARPVRRARLAAAAACVALVPLGAALTPLALLAAIALPLVALTAFDVRTR
jgi:low temperature requirement protein LtrA